MSPPCFHYFFQDFSSHSQNISIYCFSFLYRSITCFFFSLTLLISLLQICQITTTMMIVKPATPAPVLKSVTENCWLQTAGYSQSQQQLHNAAVSNYRILNFGTIFQIQHNYVSFSASPKLIQ